MPIQHHELVRALRQHPEGISWDGSVEFFEGRIGNGIMQNIEEDFRLLLNQCSKVKDASDGVGFYVVDEDNAAFARCVSEETQEQLWRFSASHLRLKKVELQKQWQDNDRKWDGKTVTLKTVDRMFGLGA